MKKLALVVILVCTFVTLFSISPVAVEMTLRVVVNGKKLIFPDAQPFIDENGRTQTPARFIGEALGAKVEWDGKEKKAMFTSSTTTLVLYIGEEEYDVNGVKNKMDTQALLLEDRTFVPARYVAEALGAKVEWDAAIRTVYIITDGTPATPDPKGGTVKYYDGISFNDVTDVDPYGRISLEKSKEFVLNAAEQLTFVKEGGKYYIECDYPEIPEGYEWNLDITIYYESGPSDYYTHATRRLDYQIPREGSFKKEAVGITGINNIDFFSIGISLDHLKTDNTGLLDILYSPDGKERKCVFVPDSSLDQRGIYTDTFNFNRMFQWK